MHAAGAYGCHTIMQELERREQSEAHIKTVFSGHVKRAVRFDKARLQLWTLSSLSACCVPGRARMQQGSAYVCCLEPMTHHNQVCNKSSSNKPGWTSRALPSVGHGRQIVGRAAESTRPGVREESAVIVDVPGGITRPIRVLAVTLALQYILLHSRTIM